MKVLAFNGSPRKGGNTEILLTAALKGAGLDIKPYLLNTMNITTCQNCGGCDESGICILEDDLTPIYDEIRSADRIILASPVYFMSVSAQTKALIDRCQSFWCEKQYLGREIEPGPHGRKGLLLLVGALEREAGIKCASSCGTAFMRTVGIKEHETLRYTGIDAKGEMQKRPEALKEARQAGQRLVNI